MTVLTVIVAYLIGSIPTAYIAGRMTLDKDIRTIGDGNMGAQNAFRQLSPTAGIVVGIVDALKGSAVILVAYAAGASQGVVMLAGFVAVVGHNWPVFLRFRGGRGMCVAIGVYSVMFTVPMAISGPLCIAVLFMTKNVIKTSVALFVTLPLFCLIFGYSIEMVGYSVLLSSIVGLTTLLRKRSARKAGIQSDSQF